MRTPLRITFQNTPSSDAIRGLIVEQVDHLEQFFGRLTACEVHLKLPADTPKHEAKARLGEWEAEVETRIATLRARRNGEGQPLTHVPRCARAVSARLRDGFKGSALTRCGAASL